MSEISRNRLDRRTGLILKLQITKEKGFEGGKRSNATISLCPSEKSGALTDTSKATSTERGVLETGWNVRAETRPARAGGAGAGGARAHIWPSVTSAHAVLKEGIKVN